MLKTLYTIMLVFKIGFCRLKSIKVEGNLGKVTGPRNIIFRARIILPLVNMVPFKLGRPGRDYDKFAHVINFKNDYQKKTTFSFMTICLT